MAIAALGSAVLLVAVLGLVGVSWQWRQTEAARKLASQKAKSEDEAKKRETQERLRAEERLLRINVANGIRLSEQGDLTGALLWFAGALKLVQGDPAQEEKQTMRFFTTFTRCPKPEGVTSFARQPFSAISQDGSHAVVQSSNQTARVWDLMNRKPASPILDTVDAVGRFYFSRDGRRLAQVSRGSGQANELLVWEVAAGRPAGPPLKTSDMLFGISFSPDGLGVAAAHGQTAQIWNVATGKATTPALQHEGLVVSVNFSPDGSRLVTASHDRTARLWKVATGEAIRPPIQHNGEVHVALFSPDGMKLLTGCEDGTARIWDARTGQPLTAPMIHDQRVVDASFSPDGLQVLTVTANVAVRVDESQVRVWSVATGERTIGPLRVRGLRVSASFSPDGSKVITSGDGILQVWHAVTGLRLCPPLRTANVARFLPDGRRITTDTGRIWDLASDALLVHLLEHPEPHWRFMGIAGGSSQQVFLVAFSPDGRRLLTADSVTARFWDHESGRAVGPPIKTMAHKLAISRDGRFVLAIGAGGGRQVDVWNTEVWSVAFSLQHEDHVNDAACSPDGKWILTAGSDSSARVWDFATGKLVGASLRHDDPVWSVAFSSDGTRFLTLSSQPVARSRELASSTEVRIWDATTRELVGPAIKRGGWINSAEFSPDAKRFVTANQDGTAQIWNVETGATLATTAWHNGPLRGAKFSADGSKVVTAGADGSARVWSVIDGRPLSAPMVHRGPVVHAEFSPDSSLVVTASQDRTARLWDADSGEPVSPPSEHDHGVEQVCFSPDGRYVASTGGLAARVWDLSRCKSFRTDFTSLAQLLSDRRIDHTGGAVPLEAELARTNFVALGRVSPQTLVASAAERIHWHLLELADAELHGRDYAALFHLERLIELQPKDQPLHNLHARVFSRVAEAHSLPNLDWRKDVPPRDPNAQPELLDLSEHYNSALTSVFQSLTPSRLPKIEPQLIDLSSLRRGVQTLAGTEFDVRGVIRLRNLGPSQAPTPVSGITVGRRFPRLHVLHATTLPCEPGAQIGRFILKYADRSQLELPVIYDQHVRHWFSDAQDEPKSAHMSVAWTGTHRWATALGLGLRLQKATWDNPRAQDLVQTIDYVPTEKPSCLLLIAITVE